ncbi:DUF5959 family protein [Streptomyces sp. NPDC057236]|uniref:DUF5959 family protein n=1 Tax=Streptomyces sp. NPDC057236 TaxID=3346059 RepID=UPI0036449E5E
MGGKHWRRCPRGQDITWMRTDRGPPVSVRLEGERDCPEVAVEDESTSMATVRVPVAFGEGRIADHQARVRRSRTGFRGAPPSPGGGERCERGRGTAPKTVSARPGRHPDSVP